MTQFRHYQMGVTKPTSHSQENVQYLLCPPSALITAVHLRLIYRINCLTDRRGMSAHSSRRASVRSCNVWGCARRRRTRLSSSSHRCSIGDKSEDKDGHSKTPTLLARRYCNVARATWGRALSCWKTKGRYWRKPRSRNLLSTVWLLIGRLWMPIKTAAGVVAGVRLSLKCNSRMALSCCFVVTRPRLRLGMLTTLPETLGKCKR